MGEWLLLAMAPVFLGFIGWEAWHWHRRGVPHYSLRDTLSNAALALRHQAADAVPTTASAGCGPRTWCTTPRSG